VNRWTQPMTLLASAFSSAAAPFVARSENIAIAWRHLRKGIWMPIGAVLVSLCVFVFAPWAVPILLGDAYSGSAAVLRVLALVAIGSIVSQPALVVLQSLGRDRFVGFAMTAAVVIQLVLVGILGSLFGAIGAAWSSLSIQVLLALLFLGAIWFEQHNFAKGLRAASAESSRAGLGREIE
jgi:O-antigen/teichoic acid export membrane protein